MKYLINLEDDKEARIFTKRFINCCRKDGIKFENEEIIDSTIDSLNLKYKDGHFVVSDVMLSSGTTITFNSL